MHTFFIKVFTFNVYVGLHITTKEPCSNSVAVNENTESKDIKVLSFKFFFLAISLHEGGSGSETLGWQWCRIVYEIGQWRDQSFWKSDHISTKIIIINGKNLTMYRIKNDTRLLIDFALNN